MNIGNKYADNKLYRGVRVGNNLPLMAEDVLEMSDTIANKNKHLLDSILGSGLIKELDISYNSTGVTLKSPAILNIEGDICLVKNSSNKYLAYLSDMYSPTSRKGIICIVGWYQHLTSSTTMREYGGVSNKQLTNDLYNTTLGIQVSTRYQFRWDVAIVHESDVDNLTSVVIPQRDANGDLLSSGHVLSYFTKKDSVYLADPPPEMDYVVDKIYIIPLIEYTNMESSHSLESIKCVDTRRPNSTGNIIKSTTEPTGRFYDGQEWFNPDTLEFKTYIQDVGFVANTTKTGFVRYQGTYTIPADNITSMNLSDLPAIQDTDILEVIYEGLQFSRGIEYNLPYDTSPTIEWAIPVTAGEKFVVTMTKLVDASNVTSLNTELTKHINSKSNNLNSGHVKLSDSISSDSNASSGVAATPKAVHDARVLKDATLGKSYVLSVDNGVLYIENTSTGVKKTLMTNLV